MKTITAAQCRAARALLNWSQPDLAARCGMHVQTICHFEQEIGSPTKRTLARIAEALEFGGVEFMDDGVRQTKNLVQILSGDDANARLLDDIFNTLKETGGTICIAGLKEVTNKDQKSYEYLLAHLDRLKEASIDERILIEEGDVNLVAPANWYRYLPKKYFSPYTFQLYANKLALINWGPPQEIIIIESAFFADSFRRLFNFAWDNANIKTP